MGSYFMAFLIGGLFCVAGQLLFDLTPFSPGHVLTGFTVAGGILGGLGVYDKLIELAGAGALLPISSFGNSLAEQCPAARSGILGVLTGMFELTNGITAAILFVSLWPCFLIPR